jgi:hypothetical protein
VLLRVAFLNSDPNYYEWAGYVIDEGRWTQGSIEVLLHGELPQAIGGEHVGVAPLFEAVNFLVFQIFGISFATARAFTAASGATLIVMFWVMLRRTVSPAALLFALALLVFQTDLIALSRLAIPEVPAMVGELLVYWVLIQARSMRGAAVGGLLTSVALGVKLTAAPIALVGVAIILLMSGDAASLRERLRRLCAYLIATAFVPFLVLISIGGLYGAAPIVARLMELTSFLSGNLHVTSLRGLAGLLFGGGFMWTLWGFGLSVWISLLLFMAGNPRMAQRVEMRHLWASALWCGIYAFVWFISDYSPTRYLAHLVIPLAINVACSVSLLQRHGISEILDSVKRRYGTAEWLRCGLLVFPSAVFLAPLVAQFIGALGFDDGRVRVQSAAIVILAPPLLAVAWSRRYSRRHALFFLLFPAISMAILVSQWVLGSTEVFWIGSIGTVTTRIGLALTVAVLASTRSIAKYFTMSASTVTVAVALIIAGVSSVSKVQTYLHEPSYSISDTSAALAVPFAGCSEIRALRSESLMINTGLRYVGGNRVVEQLPECLLLAMWGSELSNTAAIRAAESVAAEHELIGAYSIVVSQDYCRNESYNVCRIPVHAYRLPRTGQ